jgi:hypothetical protein
MKLILKIERLFQVVDGLVVRPSTPLIARRQVVHTLAIGVGSKTKCDEKDASALTIITNC